MIRLFVVEEHSWIEYPDLCAMIVAMNTPDTVVHDTVIRPSSSGPYLGELVRYSWSDFSIEAVVVAKFY